MQFQFKNPYVKRSYIVGDDFEIANGCVLFWLRVSDVNLSFQG
jgi:hypothetical protein